MQQFTTPLLAAMLLVSWLVLPQTRDNDLQPVRTSQLSIVNDDGKTVLELSGDKEGGIISIRSAQAKELVLLRTNGTGGYIQVYRHDGKPGARMWVGPLTHDKIAGNVQVYGPEGQSAVVLGSGHEGNVPVSMGAGVRGGVISLDRDGKQHNATVRGIYTFNRKMWLRLVGQYVQTERDPALYLDEVDDKSGGFSGSLVFAYKLNWQSVLFFGYGDERELDDFDDFQRSSRQLFLKVSYAFQR